MDLCNPTIVKELELRFISFSVLFGTFQLQVVACSDVIVLVGVDALQHVVFFEAQCDQLLKNDCVYWYL